MNDVSSLFAQLTADVQGLQWAPSSPPPAATVDPPSGPVSGQRKARANKTSSSPSPLGRQNSGSLTPGIDDAKAAKDLYFTGLGQENATRPAGVAPSQGGRYEGFGSHTPEPSENPSYSISSANAPTLSDFQNDPVKALGKGWSIFAAVAAGASRVVNESIIQPGMEKAMDPNLRATAAGYVSEASKRAAQVAAGANDWGKNQFGVDVVGKAKQTLLGPGSRGEYSSVPGPSDAHWNSGSYHDEGDDDFFDRHTQSDPTYDTPTTAQTSEPVATKAVPKDEDDEWKDF